MKMKMKRFKWNLMTIVALSVGAFTLPTEGVAQVGCQSLDAGDCATGGCGECSGPTCVLDSPSGTIDVSVVEGLKCGGEMDECEDANCNSPSDSLSAKGHVKVTHTGTPPSGTKYVVCEAITKCSFPQTLACGRCEVIDADTDPEPDRDLAPLECEDVSSGQYQYIITAYATTRTDCDECSEFPCSARNFEDCNECDSDVEARAASCCLTI